MSLDVLIINYEGENIEETGIIFLKKGFNMIKKIKKIKDFGVFKDFKWNALPELKKFNLIYGWNYSGKTTLSRVFRCFEKEALHNDYQEATFEFENDQTKYDQNFTQKPNIRVFNSDFIKENLKWDSESIEPILIFGQENITLQEDLKIKEIALSTAETNLRTLKQQRQEKNNKIEKALTDKAKSVGDFLSIRPFTKVHFLPIVQKVIQENIIILDQKDFDKYKIQAISTEQKPNINNINPVIPSISNLKSKVEEILQRQTASSNKVEKWLNDNELSNWIEKGKKIHDKKTVCEFCGNNLPADLFVKLNEHFSKDFETLKSDIDTLVTELNNSKINVNFPAETAFYSDILPSFETNKPLLETEINNFNSIIDIFLKDVESKKERPFDRLEISAFSDNTNQLKNALKKVTDVIDSNNKRTTDFTTDKNEAIEKLKLHFAAEFETTEKYSTIQTELTNEQVEIDTNTTAINDLKQEVTAINEELNETVKGAEKVNEYLKVFFGKDDIQIVPTDDNKFKLVRGENVAKNLSEGEKTAIAFAYFTAKLQEQNNLLENTIVYIDDPVSSLDSNHLFNIYSFIKNTFYEYKKNETDKHICKCEQLFISTHNFEFYNLVYDWFNKTKKEQQAYFTVERIRNAQKDESIIKESNSLIQKYKSEYVYLFSLIYKFHKSPTDSFEYLYHLSNICRKFIETYLNFKHLSAKNIEESIDFLITDSVKCERARKFMHYYSHDLTTDSFMKFPDFSECRDVVGIIVEAVGNNDKTHFDSLIEVTK